MMIALLYSFLACFVILWLTKSLFQAKNKLPPGPKRLPLIGNLHQLKNLPHNTLHELSQLHGDLMFMQLGSVPAIVISSADLVEHIFKSHDLVFSGRPMVYSAKKISYNFSNISFAPYGKHWRDVRKICILEVLSPKRVQSFQTIRDEEVKRMLDSIEKFSSSGTVNLSELSMILANNVLCRVAFSKKFDGAGENRVSELLREVQDLVGGIRFLEFFPWISWINKFNGFEARLEKNFMQLDKLYDEIIEDHLDPNRPEPEREDLVDVLIRASKDVNQGAPFTNDTIKGVLTDMFIAGTDTSSATIVWSMAELIRYPTAMKKAQEEVRRVVNKAEHNVQETHLPRLVYLKSAIKESLRLHPPAPLLVPRETIDQANIRGYNLPAKTRVFVNASAISLDPKVWEDPLEFRPERFISDTGVEVEYFDHENFGFIPFGFGRRGCPGANFAMVLVELAIANLLHCFDWKLPCGVEIQDLDMEEASGITVHKKSPLYLVATKPAKF